jgi:hyperosmotically inducible periplasmic protein
MKKLLLVAALGLVVAGCDQGPKSGSGSGTARDNTGVNERDRGSATKTPIDQNENEKDVGITAEIRKRVVDTKMSIAAQNVKIITQDGKVTLRGPVKTADEKAQIEKFAQEVAGAGNVDSQIEIEPAR